LPAVGPVDLDHPNVLATQMPGQSRAVGSGAFHPTACSLPKQRIRANSSVYPATVAGNSASASLRPFINITAAWWVPLWVSTPAAIRCFFGFLAMPILTSSGRSRAVRASRPGGQTSDGTVGSGSYQATHSRRSEHLGDAPGQGDRSITGHRQTGAAMSLGQPQQEHLLPRYLSGEGRCVLPLESHWMSCLAVWRLEHSFIRALVCLPLAADDGCPLWRMRMNRLLFLGDDWAEAHHDVELQDEAGRRLGKAKLADGIAGVAGFKR
jgi:hypothetical protein